MDICRIIDAGASVSHSGETGNLCVCVCVWGGAPLCMVVRLIIFLLFFKLFVLLADGHCCLRGQLRQCDGMSLHLSLRCPTLQSSGTHAKRCKYCTLVYRRQGCYSVQGIINRKNRKSWLVAVSSLEIIRIAHAHFHSKAHLLLFTHPLQFILDRLDRSRRPGCCRYLSVSIRLGGSSITDLCRRRLLW